MFSAGRARLATSASSPSASFARFKLPLSSSSSISAPGIARTSRTATMATLATFKPPTVQNEPNKHYIKGSPERVGLEKALEAFKSRPPVEVPVVIGGKELKTGNTQTQPNPSAHATAASTFHTAGPDDVKAAIDSALAAKKDWENMPFADRASVFLKAADLVSTKYRYEILAATMVGQGKNAWQAEIDAAAELCDFFRFNVQYASELYGQQPVHNPAGVWNRLEYRPLEGFVYAISPFNFTAIGGNLPAAPALMGNTVVWKPSPFAMAANYLTYNILLEAGLPPGVVQFVPGDAEQITKTVLDHPLFSALHFTGSTNVFRSLYGRIASGVAEGKYRSYPRIVGETGGKNFHLLHRSADVTNAVTNTIRGAFEFQGQKCSATSRAYVPSCLWPEFKEKLVAELGALKMGDPLDFANFVGPVIHEASFNKLSKAIDDAKNDNSLTLLAGGQYDKSKGYFIQPTVYVTTDPNHPLLNTELFGPILTILVYPDDNAATSTEAFKSACATIDSTSAYGLTGAVFAQDRSALTYAESALRSSAGNFYINTKCTGSIVGQQPFGGARASGTNDKAGSQGLLSRFVSIRSIKEDFVGSDKVVYPSNE